MNFRLGFIAPYSELGNLARVVCDELSEEVDIRYGDLGRGVELAQEMQSRKVDVIISRGGTALAIEHAVDIPVVPIQVSGFDIIRAIHAAKQFGDTIAVIGFKNVIYGTESVQDILGVSIKLIYLEEEKDAESQIAAAVKGGFRVIVGDAISTRVTAKHGATGILIQSGKEAIVKALEEAKHVAAARRREQQKAEELKTILDFAYEGIIAIDRNGIIKIFNPVAAKLLGVSSSRAVGKHVAEVAPSVGLDLVRASGRSKLGMTQRIGNTTIVGNRVPIVLGSEVEGVVFTFQDVTHIQQVEKEVRRKLYLKGHVARHAFKDIITQDEEMHEIMELASRFASANSTVLLLGETGTGKELFAQSIHNVSKRSNGPFVAVNCAALPESLLESELFGYEEGAFTGSKKGGKPGLFELAHGGTIFLDEIGDMSLPIQARLLRVLEQREVMRLGSDKVLPVDVHVVAATHKNLKEAVSKGLFRADLYYRVNVLTIVIPPLRRRCRDIEGLANHFVASFCNGHKLPRKTLTAQAMQILKEYSWPGNVRELRNICERMVVGLDGNRIHSQDVVRILEIDSETSVSGSSPDSVIFSMEGGLREINNEVIRQVLEQVEGNKTKAAELLGISRTTLWRRLNAESR